MIRIRPSTLALGLAAAVSILMAVSMFRMIYFEDRLDEIAPQAQKYRSICGGVKATLFVDRRLLHSDRQVMIDRFGGSCGDDSAVMLERCLPEPFPMAAWRRCVEVHDDNCLDMILDSAEVSIP